jgi:hypothetical protein
MDQQETINETSQAQPQAQANGEGQPAADLNINDLVAIRSVIDVACTRGTFKANEMEAVGKIYNKLSTFLESVASKKE